MPALDRCAHGAGRRGGRAGDCGLRSPSGVNTNQCIGSLLRLDELVTRAGLSYRPASITACRQAVLFWADARQLGVPTASPAALDADEILAACAATIGQPGDQVIVPTVDDEGKRYRKIREQPGIAVTNSHALRSVSATSFRRTRFVSSPRTPAFAQPSSNSFARKNPPRWRPGAFRSRWQNPGIVQTIGRNFEDSRRRTDWRRMETVDVIG